MPLANLSRAPSAHRLKDKARLCLGQSRGKTLTTEWDYCLSAQGRTIHFDKETHLTAKIRSKLNTLWGMWLICNPFLRGAWLQADTHTHTHSLRWKIGGARDCVLIYLVIFSTLKLGSQIESIRECVLEKRLCPSHVWGFNVCMFIMEIYVDSIRVKTCFQSRGYDRYNKDPFWWPGFCGKWWMGVCLSMVVGMRDSCYTAQEPDV